MAIRGFFARIRARRLARETCDHDMSEHRYDPMGADYAVCVKCGQEELDLSG